MQRLDGPFSFHLLVLSLYELPLLLAFIAAIVLSIFQLTKRQRVLISVVSVIFLVAPNFLPSEMFGSGFLNVYLRYLLIYL